MKFAALSDIHGNLGALEAVLEDIGRRGVDSIVNLGDILSGPLQPRETADCLMELELKTIRGNHERQLLAPDLAAMSASDRYAADCVTGAQREWLAGLPETHWLTDEIFMCHATPQSDVACFLEDIEEGQLLPAPLARIEERAQCCSAPLILCGHTHIPRIAFLSTGQIIVNPGSVGIQAYDGNHPIPHTVELGAPHARYVIIERCAGRYIADLIAVPYDWDSAACLAAERSRPDWARALRSGYVRP